MLAHMYIHVPTSYMQAYCHYKMTVSYSLNISSSIGVCVLVDVSILWPFYCSSGSDRRWVWSYICNYGRCDGSCLWGVAWEWLFVGVVVCGVGCLWEWLFVGVVVCGE